MTIPALLRDAGLEGVRLFCQDGRLAFEASRGSFPAALRERIVAHKAELMVYLSAAAGVQARPSLTARARAPGCRVPASFGQERLRFLDGMYEGSAHYNMPSAYRVQGPFDPELAHRALARLVARHEPLRTNIVEDGDGCCQRIGDGRVFALVRDDLSTLAPQERARQLQVLINEHARAPFDLATDLMLRASFVRLGENDGALLLNVHHIACDGWSMDILRAEFLLQYAVLAQGVPDPLPALQLQYADYAQWQRDCLVGSEHERQLGYWKRQLAELPLLHNLPLDHPRPPVQSFAGATHAFDISRASLDGLRRLASAQKVTLFMVIHAAFSLLLARHSGTDDVVIGTPLANRQHKELEPLVGFLVNTLVLRSNSAPDCPFTDYLAQIRVVNLDAQAHGDIPFETLVEHINPIRSASHTPLFQILLNMADSDPGSATAPALAGMSLTPLHAAHSAAKFDLTLSVQTTDAGLSMNFEYSTALFDAPTIARLGRRLLCLFDAIVADPTCAVHALPIIDRVERDYLLKTFNATAAPFPREASIDGLFELQAARSPGAAAVEDCGGVLTYAQLNERANRLAHHLIGCGVGPASLVGVCMERSAQSVVALLAILKAGGAYVALDPRYPDQRLADMVDDSGVGWLLTQTSLRERLAAHAVLGRAQMALLAVDEPALVGELAQRSAANPARVADPTGLAYLIYTSGSTGRPKAVAICHRNTVAMISWAAGAFSARELRRVLFSTSLNFDLSVFELFVPLSLGGTVVVVADAMALLDKAGGAALDLSLINTVPSACRVLVDSGAIPASVCVVNLAGEALPPALVNALLDCPTVERVCNLYGPSEDTTYSSHISYTDKLEGAVSIGRPIDNTQFYLLDRYGKPVPLGVAGEIYIGGAGVALGYLNRPELSAQRFLVDPFAAPGGRMYRTGDLARWLADGTLEYLGRNDFQVKLRGFRIELGEIEACLCRCEGVREAVVIAREDTPGQPRLVAYLSTVPGQAEAVLLARVRAALQQALPDYMMPSAFVVLAALPLNANGKVDRKALPAPAGTVQERVFVAPQTPLEQLVASVWSDLLQVPQVGMDDDFFVCGGHSILAVRMTSRLKTILAINFSLQQLFRQPTIRGIVAGLKERLANYGDVEEVARTYLDILNLSPEEVANMLAETEH